MGINQTGSAPTPNGEGRAACAACDDIYAALDKHGVAYEVVMPCNWCKVEPADSDPDMDGCCGEDCRYRLARDEGFVTDAEHSANVAEGWAS